MEIRSYKAKDSGQVKKLISDILNLEFDFGDKAYQYCDLDAIEKVYGGKREAFFVLDDNKTVGGTAGVKEESKKTAIIRRLFVSKSLRKNGYGGLLLDRAIDFCKKNGYHEVVFHAATAMKSAMDLCRSRGFEEKEKIVLGDVDIIRFSLTF